MVDIKDNTVPAENQMINSSDLRFLGDKNAPLKILVVGNSITIHGPNTEIGWLGDWGMAASSIENDYVHKLFEKLKQDSKDVYMRIRQCAFWERNYIYDNVLSNYDYERDFNADIVIFRLGENINEKDIPLFKEALEKFINHICPNGKVLFTTCFWERTRLDNDILEFANSRGESCINCCFSKDDKNMALGQFEHSGVAMHPNDNGMEAIAQAIFNGLKPYFD